MDTRFSEDQEMLRTSARDFLSRECTKTMVRELEASEKGYSPEMWQKMADLGWMGLAIPEEHGGAGLSFQDLTILVEEMGRNVVPGPFLSTTVSAMSIMAAGTAGQKKEYLPRIAKGDLIMSPALLESDGTFQASAIKARATPDGEGFIINGTKLFVEMAQVADYLICVARTKEDASPEKGITLFLVDARDAGIHCETIPTIARDRLCEVTFTNVRVPRANVLGEVNGGWPVVLEMLRKGAIAKCAECVGGMQACVDMTVAYSKDRVQYDRPIGAFQALQHIMADMWIALETSRYLTYEAAWMESGGLSCDKEVSMAKLHVNKSYDYVSKWGVRLHGAIGTTRDHDMSLYYLRAKAADYAFGTADFHTGIVAEKMGLG